MAIYHLSAKLISRKAGRSSTAAAAYRAGERIVDERTGEVHDYTRKASVDHAEIVMPSTSDWRPTRAELWNTVERKNKRADAQVAREFEVALPVELSAEDRQRLAVDFAHEIADSYGIAADVAIHHQNGENPHAHILTTTNRIDGNQLGNKARELDLVAHNMAGKVGQENEIDRLRESWEKHANLALERAGQGARIDHRTLEAQGIDRIPQIHIGAKVAEMEARGVETERGAVALNIEAANAEIYEIRANGRIGHGHNHETTSSPEPGPDRGGTRAPGRSLGVAGRGNDRGADPVAAVQPGAGAGLEPGAAGRGRGMEAGRGEHSPGREAGPGSRGDDRSRGQQTDVEDIPGLRDHGGDVCGPRDLVLALAGAGARDQEHARPGSGRGAPETGPRRGATGKTGEAAIDRTYLAVRRQLQAMGCDQVEVGIRDQDGRMMTRTWTPADALTAVPWLKRQNALGADIYVRPGTADGQNAGLVLVDDVPRGTVERMKAEGYTPAAVVETSPQNFQAWIRLAADRRLPAEVATVAAKKLAELYQADPNSADWRHFGRLAGFTNRKPTHVDETGRSPYVLAHECPGKAAENAAKLISAVEEGLDKAKAEKERQKRLQAIQKARPADGFSARYDPKIEYTKQAQRLIQRYSDKADFSRLDWMIAQDMAGSGRFTVGDIERAIRECSPHIEERKAGHIEDYAKRTAQKAVQEAEGTQQRQTRDRGYDGPSR